MDQDSANRYMILPHYTAILQPSNFRITKSLKDRLKKEAVHWRREQHASSSPGNSIRLPERKDVLLCRRKHGNSFQWKS